MYALELYRYCSLKCPCLYRKPYAFTGAVRMLVHGSHRVANGQSVHALYSINEPRSRGYNNNESTERSQKGAKGGKVQARLVIYYITPFLARPLEVQNTRR